MRLVNVEDIDMKIVVTGANGYLGTGIVKQLCDDGNKVIAVCHHDSEEIFTFLIYVYINIMCIAIQTLY